MRRAARILLGAAAGVAVLGLGARMAAWAHVRTFTREGSPADLDCRRCHGDWSLYWKGPQRERHPDPMGMAVSADGRTLGVACEGTDSVVLVDTASGRVRADVPFPAGAMPHGVAFTADGGSLLVSLRGRGTVARVDVRSLAVVESGPVGRAPCGVALAPGGGPLVVACAESGDAALLDPATLEVLVRLHAGREPYRVAVSPDGRYAHVVNRMSEIHGPLDLPASEVAVLDLAARRVAARVALPSCHLSEGIAFLADGSRSVVPVVRVRNRLPISQVARGWVMSGGLALVPADGSGAAALLPTDDMDRCWSDPTGVAVAAGGAACYLAASGASAVSRISVPRLLAAAAAPPPVDGGDPIDRMDLAADFVEARLPAGADPREIVASADGSRVFVAERWDGKVAVLDAADGRLLRRVDLGGPEGDPSPARRGDRVFHDASVTFQSGFACRSCHPDGHQDGLGYDFETDGPGRNPVDNRSLLGIRGTNPFKWTGLNPGLADQCGPRFAKVLTRADPFPARDLADLVAYIESRPARRGDGASGPAVERGRKVFYREALNDGRPLPEKDRCQTCHPAPLYTNRKSMEVGTRGPRDTNDAFDTPHLVGVEGSAPFLHDGRARTLEEIWTVHNPDDRHGVTSDMTKQQLNDLIEFLKTL